MKRSDLERIASVVGKLIRAYVAKFSTTVEDLVGRVGKIEKTAETYERELQERCTTIVAAEIEKLRKSIKIPTAEEIVKLIPVPVVPTRQEIAAEVKDLVIMPDFPTADEIATAYAQRAPTIEQIVAAIPKPELPSTESIVEQVMKLVHVPTAEDVAKLVVVPKPEAPSVPSIEQIVAAVPKPADPPSIDAVVDQVMKRVPTAEDIAKLVVVPTPEVPTIEQIVAAVPKAEPAVVPTTEEIARHVVPLVKVPTAEEISKHVIVPKPEEIAALVPVPAVPSVDEIAQKVLPSVLTHVPRAAEIVEQVMQLVKIPTAKEIAAEVPQPEPVIVPEVRMPDVAEIIEGLKKHIPQPVKGDPGESVDIEDVTLIVEGNFAKWALEFERRASDQLRTFLAGIKPPENGKDGFGFDDMTLDYDGERTVTITFQRADKAAKSFTLDLPIVIYRGVYHAGEEYKRGDSVTWDGCTWIAKTGTAEKPGQSDSWQLAVKKGRDGRDGDDPKKPAPRVRVAPRTGGGS